MTKAVRHVMRRPVSNVPYSRPNCVGTAPPLPFIFPCEEDSFGSIADLRIANKSSPQIRTVPSLLPVTIKQRGCSIFRLRLGDNGKRTKSLILEVMPAALPPS